jgi:hypothetical protein
MRTLHEPSPLSPHAREGGVTLLLATARQSQLAEYAHPNLGRLAIPDHFECVGETAAAGVPWAADNGCFHGLDHLGFYRMLDRLKGTPGCLFVCVPDVVGDAVATAHRFEAWSIGVERRGLPMALVLQDGIEDLLDWYGYHFHRLAGVFIGGTTEWKMGDTARAFAQHAHRNGLWVHWGRVNTERRVRYVKSTGACDSFDGSGWAKWRKANLRRGLALAAAPSQLALEAAA